MCLRKMYFMGFYLFCPGDFVTHTGEQENRSVSRRLPDNTGEQHSIFIMHVLFQPFQLGVRLIEKVDQQSQSKHCFFPTKTRKILTNQKELIVIEHNPRVPDNYHGPQLALTV